MNSQHRSPWLSETHSGTDPLAQLYASARDAQGPSPDAWARMAAVIDAATALPVPQSVPHSLLHRLGMTWGRSVGIGCGLLALGGWWLTRQPQAQQTLARANVVVPATPAELSPAADATRLDSPMVLSAVSGALENPALVTALPLGPQLRSKANVGRDLNSARKPHREKNSFASGQNAPFNGDVSQMKSPAAAANAGSDDAELLHDLAVLNRVELLLRQNNGAQATQLLNVEPIYRMNQHATALRAAALCQSGQRAQGAQLLETLGSSTSAATARSRALKYCETPVLSSKSGAMR